MRTQLGEEPSVPLPLKEVLYRVAQEALNNVVRHAGASEIALTLQQGDSQLCLEIVDNGRGFDPQQEFPGHFGLHSMRERVETVGGRFELESTRGAGTRVRATVAIPNHQH